MATVAVHAPDDVPTTLNYLRPTDETTYFYSPSANPPEGKPRSYLPIEAHSAVIHDVRGKEDTVNLDKTGLQFVKHKSSETEFLDEERVKNVYCKEIEELLKRVTGGRRVFIFDHTIRYAYSRIVVWKKNVLIGLLEAELEPRKQATGPTGADDRKYYPRTCATCSHRPIVQGFCQPRALSSEGGSRTTLKGRVRLINVWRPMGAPVAHYPLAVADYRTLDTQNDLVPTQLVYPDRVGETFSIKYNPQLQWYYLSHQTPEEVTLIKCFDSDEDKAGLTPHTSFVDTSDPAELPPRQSIEARALVFDEE